MTRPVLFAAALSALVVAISAAPTSAARANVAVSARTHHSSPHMTWYHASRTAAVPRVRAGSAGRRVVVGLAAMYDLAALQARYGFRLIHALPSLHAAEVAATPALIASARTDARIRYLSPQNGAHQLLTLPSAPLLTAVDPNTGAPYEWQFAAADVSPALDLSAGSPSIAVGTIDSGTADIPDLAGKIDSRWIASPNGSLREDNVADDYRGHGTAVASLIAGNGYGMTGFGGATHLVSIRAPVLTDLAVAAALMKLDDLGVRIVNMSFGQPGPERPIMLDAIHKAEADGMLLIAATGNSSGPVAHPAADLQPEGGQEGVGLAVGASDASGKLAFFSNFGDNLSLVAPGNDRGRCSGVLVAAPLSVEFVTSCYPSWTSPGGASYAYVAGTSFAAPEVAGIAALIWAVRPTLQNYQVADIIKQSARRSDPGWTPTIGCGALDAGAALDLAVSRSAAEWAAAPPASGACSS